jgi:hypothetical protein
MITGQVFICRSVRWNVSEGEGQPDIVVCHRLQQEIGWDTPNDFTFGQCGSGNLGQKEEKRTVSENAPQKQRTRRAVS